MSDAISMAFQQNLLPIAYDIGKCIFMTTTIGGIYVLIRGNQSEAIKRIKNACIGYICLKLITSFISLVDKVTATLHF